VTVPRHSALRHVVMFSGGAGSWAAAKRIRLAVNADDITLLFADTLVEDPDLYRFLDSAERNLNCELVRVADGRTPFEVFHDDRFLGNSRLANCSKYLKIEPCRTWLDANRDPADTILHVGIDWSEIHRLPAITNGWKPYKVRAPLCDPPYLSKEQILDWLKAERLHPPKAYAEGFPHNNCLAQGCVRGGQAYWQTLLRQRPDAYAYAESNEQDLRDYLEADVTILKDRRGGDTRPLTLGEFRERLEAQPSLFDGEEWGGCGCFVDTPIDVALGEAA
jgi:3'-phosphoadenosine 5'-phosphosulfate sulfotransferase (PAPS reductase)/FAD synthetase